LPGGPEQLAKKIDAICADARLLETELADELARVHPRLADSAANLIHYVALRRLDIRELQEQLTLLGLSSLSTSEQHVMPSLQAVRYALLSMIGHDVVPEHPDREFMQQSGRQLETHSDDLFGANPDGLDVEIMVTLPQETADNCKLLQDLVKNGMDIARINCAHDTEADWLKMIANVKQVCGESDRTCKIIMDLAGPKVRTGALRPGPGVLRIRPRRDELGRVAAPRRLRLVAEDSPRRSKKQTDIPVPAALIGYAKPGDTLQFRDTRGRHRQLKITGKDKKGLLVEAHKRAYLATGTKLRLLRTDSGEKLKFRIGRLPPIELAIVVVVGDILLLDGKSLPGEPAQVDEDGTTVSPAHISCMPPEIVDRVPLGAAVLLNDGKIGGIVEDISDDGLVVRITHAKSTGSRLRSNRSINFPGTDLMLRGLTDTDKHNLVFIAEHADMVNLSFVRSPADVVALEKELEKYETRRPGIVLKIETEEAFNKLPRILLAAMRSYPVGIMIARGDLAVECGWERLAEIQEEVLWM